MGFLSSVGSMFGGGSGKTNSSTTSTTAPSTVWSPQTPYLTANYGQGQALANAQMQGGRFEQQNTALNNAWQSQLAGPTNPYLTGMASNAMRQISKQFNEEIMPNLLGGGNAAGQLGQERYQNLQNSAVDTAATAMSNAANDVYGRAYDSGLQAQSQAIGQAGDVMAAPWTPLQQQAGILGSPTVLSGGSTSNSSTNSTDASKGMDMGMLTTIGSWMGSAMSDERLKDDVELIPNALDKVMQLKGVTYEIFGSRETGVIAQDVQAVLPEAIITTDTDEKYLAVKYPQLVGLLVEAIKELNEKVNDGKW